MKNFTICILGLPIFLSCNGPAKNAEKELVKDTLSVGKDKDNHGCIPSAGYTWSEIKKDCVQIFNEGFRLNPVEVPDGKEVISAFLLVSDDQSAVELFLPGEKKQSIILKRINRSSYQNENYRYDAEKSVLYQDEKLTYKGNVE